MRAPRWAPLAVILAGLSTACGAGGTSSARRPAAGPTAAGASAIGPTGAGAGATGATTAGASSSGTPAPAGPTGLTGPPAGASSAIEMAPAESAARKLVAEQTGAAVSSVRCPTESALKVGSDLSCKATGADGTTARVVMTVKDARGDVSLRPLALLETASAARLIADALTHEYKSAVDVKCPDLVSAHKNTTMTCHATHAGVALGVLVTVKDDAGSLAYRLEEPPRLPKLPTGAAGTP